MSINKYQPHLSFIQILNMSVGFLGVQFAFALQNSDAIWLAGTVTGLLVQPVTGYYSDRTWRAWGRRRPYLIVGALLCLSSFIMMANSSDPWIITAAVWMMFTSVNILMVVSRAIVGDMLPPAQRTSGFAIQAIFIVVGGLIAMLVSSKEYSLYIGGAVLFCAVMYTVLTTKEYPPTETAQERIRNRESGDRSFFAQRFAYTGISFLSIGLLIGIAIVMLDLVPSLYVLAGGLVLLAIIHFIASLLISSGNSNSAVVNMVRDFHDMPTTMKKLAVVQFFSWIGLSAFEAFREGGILIGSFFSIESFSMAIVVFILITIIASSIGRNAVHLIALVCGAAGMISFYFISDQNWLWLQLAGVCIAWASILSMPYSILSDSLKPSKMGYYMGIFNFFVVIPQIIVAASFGPILRIVFAGESALILVIAGCCLIFSGLLTLRIVLK